MGDVLPQLGAAGSGFVFGWVVYFAIRDRAGPITAHETCALICAMLGSAVTGYVAITTADATQILGAYGVGVFVGFTSHVSARSYRATSGGQQLGPRVPFADARTPAALHRAVDTEPAQSAPDIATRDAARAAVAKINTLVASLNRAIAEGPADALQDLMAVKRDLTRVKMTCLSFVGLASLTQAETTDVLGELTVNTQELTAAAEPLKHRFEPARDVDLLLELLGKLKSTVAQQTRPSRYAPASDKPNWPEKNTV